MKFKDLFLSFSEWLPETIIEIYIKHERLLMKAGEAVYEYGELPVLSFTSKTVYIYKEDLNDESTDSKLQRRW